MSRYVLELNSDIIKSIVAFGMMGETGVSTVFKIDELEELNSDYINEHFGDLQDSAYRKGRESVFHELEISGSQKGESAKEAYQRGFEDGKAVNDKGCEGCEHEGKNKMTNPCILCCNSYKNRWGAKSDKIEVGDEVTHKSDSVVWKAVCIQIDGDGRHMNLMGHTGAVGYYPVEDFKKTGRHFDIASILEDMRK